MLRLLIILFIFCTHSLYSQDFWDKSLPPFDNVKNKDISEIILKHPAEEWKNKEAIICEPIKINKIKKMKMIIE